MLAESFSDNRHFYPRSPCGERHSPLEIEANALIISIHALLAESDRSVTMASIPKNNFYPRSPCGERRVAAQTQYIDAVFLSTLSLRRATSGHSFVATAVTISIHALLAESDPYCTYKRWELDISIHALLAESDGRVKSL